MTRPRVLVRWGDDRSDLGTILRARHRHFGLGGRYAMNLKSTLTVARCGSSDRHTRTVRVVEATITVVVDGITRTERYRLVTSLLDPRSAPADELATLYARRWAAETGIGEIKTVLLAGGPMRPRTDLRTRQELWAALIVYQSLRILACQAALGTGIDPSQISLPRPRKQTRTLSGSATTCANS